MGLLLTVADPGKKIDTLTARHPVTIDPAARQREWSMVLAALSDVVMIVVAAAVVANLLMVTYLHALPTLFSFLCAIIFAAWFGGVGLV